MSRSVIAGGTGYVGSLVARALHARGQEVTVLTRDPERPAPRLPETVKRVRWTPAQDGPWQAELSGVDTVVNLAGEVLVGRRYTAALKREFVRSRVGVTEAIVRGIEKAEVRPRTFLCASAIGYYGTERGHEPLGEDAAPGADFLAKICVDWEAAAGEANALGVRVAMARLGIVLGRDAPALRSMARPFQMFVGGPIGSGEQMFSWVHETDAVNMLLDALDRADFSGPFNVTAPNPCTNRELSEAMGQALERPVWLSVPGAALKLLFGDGAEPILGGQRVIPARLQAAGFQWQYTDIRAALTEALGEQEDA